MDQDITHLVERLEAFEDRVGLELDGLFAWIAGPDDDDEFKVVVNGEAHATHGTELENNIWITLAVYDRHGRVIGTATEFISADEFFGFEAFSITTWVKEPATKLRVYPKPV